GMLLDLLPHRQAALALLLGQARDVGRWAREFLPEQRLDHPVAAKDGTGPRRPGLAGLYARQSQHPAAPVLPHPLDPAPPRPGHAGDAIMLRQGLVEERVIRVEDLRHGAVALEQVLEEQDRFLVDRLAKVAVERR